MAESAESALGTAQNETSTRLSKSQEIAAKKLVLGGLAGTVAKTVVAPLERVRIMAQTGHGQSTMFGTARLILRNEGVAGLWRGNFVNCIRVFPSRGILFATNDIFKTFFVHRWVDGDCTVKDGKMSKNGQSVVVPFWISFSSGASAGMVACMLTYPLDVARTRMAGKLVESTTRKSMVGTLSEMLRVEGFRSWYRGIGPTLGGSLPYEGIKFAAYDVTMNILSDSVPPTTSKVALKLMSGGIAGAVAGFLMFPNDTVRRLLQMQGEKGHSIVYTSAWDCWVKTYRNEGPGRFFRGIIPYLIRIAPNSAIQFGVYEFFRDKV